MALLRLKFLASAAVRVHVLDAQRRYVLLQLFVILSCIANVLRGAQRFLEEIFAALGVTICTEVDPREQRGVADRLQRASDHGLRLFALPH